MTSETFRTVFKPEPFDFKISYNSNMMFIGSCFTENIGNKLQELKFNVNINPFGIIYNPISVAKSLEFIIDNKQFKEEDLFFYNEYWHSFYHHGKYSETDKEKGLEMINSSLSNSFNFLKKTNFLFITFGTAMVYSHIKNDIIVANCHKIPAVEFEKRMLNESEIIKVYNNLIEKLRLINDKLKIIFSVSPVRHLKDGFSENFLSKSILRTAIEKIRQSDSDIYYFPAFEILNDDLRDYRFYDTDLVHPNDTAVNYIFDFFKKTFFSDETGIVLKKIQKIVSASKHRIFDKNTMQSRKFIANTLNDIDTLEKSYPFPDFEKEKEYFLSLK